jgi:hypothetical protein
MKSALSAILTSLWLLCAPALAVPGADRACVYAQTYKSFEAMRVDEEPCIAGLAGLVRISGGLMFVTLRDGSVQPYLRPALDIYSRFHRFSFYDHARGLLYFRYARIHDGGHMVIDLKTGDDYYVSGIPIYSPNERWGLSRDISGYPGARNFFALHDFKKNPPEIVYTYPKDAAQMPIPSGYYLDLDTPAWEGNRRIRFAAKLRYDGSDRMLGDKRPYRRLEDGPATWALLTLTDGRWSMVDGRWSLRITRFQSSPMVRNELWPSKPVRLSLSGRRVCGAGFVGGDCCVVVPTA